MSIKITIPQSILLRRLVNDGPQVVSRKDPSAIRLVELGYAEWLNARKAGATEKGEKFVRGELS